MDKIDSDGNDHSVEGSLIYVCFLVVVISANKYFLKPFLVAALKKGMTGGQYVYIISELSYDYLQWKNSPSYWWSGTNNKDIDLAERAFHSVLALVPRPYNVTKYEEFESRVIEKFREYPFYNSEVVMGKVSDHGRLDGA